MCAIISKTFISETGAVSKTLKLALSDLNEQPAFKKYCDSKSLSSSKGKLAHYVLLHDLKVVLESIGASLSGSETVSDSTKLLTLHAYELVRDVDLFELYSLEELNKLVSSDRFGYNYNIVRNLSVFDGKEPSVLLLSGLRDRSLRPFVDPIKAFLTFFIEHAFASTLSLSKLDDAILKGELAKLSTDVTGSIGVQVPAEDTLEKVLAELNELIGLEEVKQSVSDLSNYLKVQTLRKEKGLNSVSNSLHIVFMGPPGTGKTTVARLMGRLYKCLGYLEKGHLIEADRSSLVAGYVGQTAIKTDEIISQAEGGVLFVDEAYSLTSGGLNDYGSEAIEVLLKRMEDNRGNLAVVVAGYPDEMEEFITSNPGLQSRFNRYFTFDHFSVSALMRIFKRIAVKSDFHLTANAEEKLLEIVERVHENKHDGFGNARTMRNLFEKIVERQANRIVKLESVTKESLCEILEDDVPEVLETVKSIAVFD